MTASSTIQSADVRDFFRRGVGDTIDDATLKQTAKAYVKVRQIVQNAEIALNGTTDNAQQQQIAKQASQERWPP